MQVTQPTATATRRRATHAAAPATQRQLAAAADVFLLTHGFPELVNFTETSTPTPMVPVFDWHHFTNLFHLATLARENWEQ